MRIVLDFLIAPSGPLDLRPVRVPDIFRLPAGEVERLRLAFGRETPALGELCRVSSEASGGDELVLRGETTLLDEIGSGMTGGRLVVEGNVGQGAGAGMSGGKLDIRGSAGDCLGEAMLGGTIRVDGDAGCRAGAARSGQATGMGGGLIWIAGSCGPEAGAGMRRGLIAIGGSTGEYPGARMNAGTLISLGRAGRHPGLGMKRGSILAGQMGDPGPGFRPCGAADPEWLRVYAAWLHGQGIALPEGWLADPPRRFTGDHLGLGKGEILAYDLTE